MNTTNLSPPTPSKHARTPSANIRRIALQRRTTKGPLELDDPLASSSASLEQAPTPPPGPSSSNEPLDSSTIQPSPSTSTPDLSLPARPTAEQPSKDYTFLLRPEIYQPLSDQDLVPSSRNTTLTPSSTTNPTTHLQTLLAQGRYHTAAIYCTTLLLNPAFTSPTNAPLIFSLFQTRLTCLLLLSRTAQAAEESKTLQDLENPFYLSTDGENTRHIVPWSLRVLVVRLQALGFGDARRGIVGFYELAREARVECMRSTSPKEKLLWKERLRELGVHVANALVEMGDLQGAARHLRTLKVEGHGEGEVRAQMRLALVYLRLGDRDAALQCFTPQPTATEQDASVELARQIVLALSATAANPTSSSSAAATTAPTAEEAWSTALNLSASTSSPEQQTFIHTNRAVALVYAGRINEARALLERLIDDSLHPASSFDEEGAERGSEKGAGGRAGRGAGGGVEKATLFNLCTIYELSTERARDAKLALAGRVVGGGGGGGGGEGDGEANGGGTERGLVDFKL